MSYKFNPFTGTLDFTGTGEEEVFSYHWDYARPNI